VTAEPFIPWDATEGEIADLQVVREEIPETLVDPLFKWLTEEVGGRNSYASINQIHHIETSLRTRLELQESATSDDLVLTIAKRGRQFILRVVDLILSGYQPEEGVWQPTRVSSLATRMIRSGSALEIAERNGVYRLRRRIVEGVEEAGQRAVHDANPTAGRHLATAMREAQEMEPDASKVMRESIQAVEAAAGPVVIPNDKQPRLRKIFAAIRDQDGWGLVFAQRDDGHPDHKAVLTGMIETLVFAEQSRHSGPGYTTVEAVGHVQLAATLVGWFSTGVARREV